MVNIIRLHAQILVLLHLERKCSAKEFSSFIHPRSHVFLKPIVSLVLESADQRVCNSLISLITFEAALLQTGCTVPLSIMYGGLFPLTTAGSDYNKWMSSNHL